MRWEPALETLDGKLTPARGLRRWQDGKREGVAAPARTDRALLFVHGTFSKSDMFFTELTATDEGRRFLDRAQAQYRQILAFDHPTLCVSPILNALDLAKALDSYAGTLDVVCHSRGGLVTSWWLRTGARKAKRIVFVASPLEGTSLAAPARLKDALHGLANIAEAVETTATVAGGFVPPAAPLLGVAAGLMKIVGGFLSVGAATPLLDAGVAMVPGLAAQSRVGNNQELLRLHEGVWPSRPEYLAVSSSFQPGDPDAPWWKFWRRWGSPLAAGAHAAADAVFLGANDLVVDVKSMNRLIGTVIPSANVKEFGVNPRVHHGNYFAQPETATFLAKALQIT